MFRLPYEVLDVIHIIVTGNPLQVLEYRINCDMKTPYAGDDGMLLSRKG